MKLKRKVRNRIEATGKSTLAVMLAFTLTLGLGLSTALATDSAQGGGYSDLGATAPEAETFEPENNAVVEQPAPVADEATISDNVISEADTTSEPAVQTPTTFAGDYTFNPADGSLQVYTNKGTTAWRSDGVAARDIKAITFGPDVTEILVIPGKDGTFAGTAVESIIIPSTIKGVSGFAFSGCASLRTVHIQSSSGMIGEFAFAYCGSLTSVTIDEGIASIEANAFSDSRSLATVNIPESVKTIGKFAFSNNKALTSVTLPASVTGIKESAFSGCSSLARVDMQSETPVVDMPANVFDGLPSEYKIWVPEVALDAYKTDVKWSVYASHITSLVGLGYTFENGELTILKNMGSAAWREAVPSIDPAAVTSIVFGPSVTEISMPSEGVGAFSGTAITSVIVPRNVLGVAPSAFSNCKSLTSVTIQSASGEIGTSAFSECSALETLVMEQGVTNLGASAFMDCTALLSVSIPEGITQIGRECFRGASLTSVTIPASVTEIGREAFAKVSTFIVLGKTPAKLGIISLGNTESLPAGFVIKVPLDVVDIYKAAWAKYKDYIVGETPTPGPTPGPTPEPTPVPTPEPKPLPVGGGSKLASTGDPLSVLPIAGISLAALAGVALVLARKKVSGK